MTAAERQPDQELSRSIEECRRAAADLTQELARVATRFGTRVYEDTILKIGSDLALIAERFADDPGETADSLLASFPQTRVEGEFFAGFAAVFTILANAVRGGEFERAVLKAMEAAKNPIKIEVEGVGRSIPDILDKGITEIKSGVEIDSSPQLRTQSAYARKNRVPFNAVVSPATRRISKSVRELVSDTGGTIQRSDPATDPLHRTNERRLLRNPKPSPLNRHEDARLFQLWAEKRLTSPNRWGLRTLASLFNVVLDE
jgi:hypothetical protein